MSIYDDLKPVAAGVIKEFKQGFVQYVKITPGNGPVDEPGPNSEAKTTLNATVGGVSFRYTVNGFATAADLMVTTAPVAGITPDMKDFVEIDGARYKIIQVIKLPAAGTTLVWKFIVSKGGTNDRSSNPRPTH